jgi:hypothetical protein
MERWWEMSKTAEDIIHGIRMLADSSWSNPRCAFLCGVCDGMLGTVPPVHDRRYDPLRSAYRRGFRAGEGEV